MKTKRIALFYSLTQKDVFPPSQKELERKTEICHLLLNISSTCNYLRMKYKLFCKLINLRWKLSDWRFFWLSQKVDDLIYSKFFTKEWNQFYH